MLDILGPHVASCVACLREDRERRMVQHLMLNCDTCVWYSRWETRWA